MGSPRAASYCVAKGLVWVGNKCHSHFQGLPFQNVPSTSHQRGALRLSRFHFAGSSKGTRLAVGLCFAYMSLAASLQKVSQAQAGRLLAGSRCQAPETPEHLLLWLDPVPKPQEGRRVR